MHQGSRQDTHNKPTYSIEESSSVSNIGQAWTSFSGKRQARPYGCHLSRASPRHSQSHTLDRTFATFLIRVYKSTDAEAWLCLCEV